MSGIRSDRSSFKEEVTSGRQLSFSRGWGISQKTLFTSKPGSGPVFVSAVPDSSHPGRFVAGPERPFRVVSGIPMADPGDNEPPIPLFITSAGKAANAGAKVYVDAFKSLTRRRDCTYSTKYDCANCVANLETGRRQIDKDTGKPRSKGGMRFFDEADGDFERVYVGQDLASHRFRNPDRLVQLIRQGTYVIPGKTADTLTSDDAVEFPCSWLTAITRYAGVNEIAWYYPLDRIDAIKNKTE